MASYIFRLYSLASKYEFFPPPSPPSPPPKKESPPGLDRLYTLLSFFLLHQNGKNDFSNFVSNLLNKWPVSRRKEKSNARVDTSFERRNVIK